MNDWQRILDLQLRQNISFSFKTIFNHIVSKTFLVDLVSLPELCAFVLMISDTIYFEKLKDLKVKSIGVFGTREEVLDTLYALSGISKSIFNALKSDDSNNGWLKPGIHAVLPANLQQPGIDWDGMIFVLYWPMTASFDKKRTMKATKYMRKV